MYKRLHQYLTFAKLFVLLVIVGCGSGERTAGSGISTGNAKISGKAVDENGKPVKNSIVYILPDTTDPFLNRNAIDKFKTLTDHLGNYNLLFPVGANSYNLIIRDSINNISSLIKNLVIKEFDDYSVDEVVLRPSSTIVLPLSQLTQYNGYVYLPGTDIYQTTILDKPYITLENVPSGVYTSLNYAKIDGGINVVAQTVNLEVLQGSRVNFDPWEKWPKFKNLSLNIDLQPRQINQTVVDLPLKILIDTNWSSIDVSKQTIPDLIFLNQVNRLVPYEISYQSSNTRKIVAWVRLDSIYPTKNTNPFWARWGNTDSITLSQKELVFDTAKGFSAVWHFDDSLVMSPLDTLSITDATFHHFNTNAVLHSVKRDGFIGRGLNLLNNDEINFKDSILNFVQQNFTISFWVKVSDNGGVVFSKSSDSNQFGDKYIYFTDNINGTQAGLYPAFKDEGNLKMISQKALYPDTWHHIVFRKTNIQSLFKMDIFVDGIQTKVQTVFDKDSLATLNMDPVGSRIKIGSLDSNTITGAVDELWIQNKSVSNDWIMLNYFNQLSASTFP